MINLYFGPVVNPKSLTHFDALPRCLIAVGSDGNIIWIENGIDPSAVQDIVALRGLKDGEYNLVDLTANSGEFIMPGLIDTHVHACQFPNLGIGGDDQLLDWLQNYVFPTEQLFKDEKYARSVYEDVIRRSIASGTTTSCYYASLHLPATKILACIVREKGQRAFVGKCNMDWPETCPDYYIDESPKVSLEQTKELIQHIQTLPPSPANEPLVHPIITPRFALSCSETLLTELGQLAQSLPHVAIQTHISENRQEVADALKRFKARSYAEIYDRFGLLRHNTVLGHGVWLTEEEMALIAEKGAGVAHCPTSNFYLSSGMARVGLLLDYGVKVGLGTDVGGGYNPSVLYAIQMASTTSKMVAVQAELDEEHRQRCHHHHHGLHHLGHRKHHGQGKRHRHGKRRGHRHGKHGKHGHGESGVHVQEHGEGHSDSDSDSDSDLDLDGGAEEAKEGKKADEAGRHGYGEHDVHHDHGHGHHDEHHHDRDHQHGRRYGRHNHYRRHGHHSHHQRPGGEHAEHHHGRHDDHENHHKHHHDRDHQRHHEHSDDAHHTGKHPDPYFNHHHGHDHSHHHHNSCHSEHKPQPPQHEFTNQKLKLDTLLYLATLGGAHVCALQTRIGSFEIGKAFDALHVSLDDALGNPAVWGRGVPRDGQDEREPTEGNVRRWLERFLFGGDSRNVRRVFVQGLVIGGVDAGQDEGLRA